MFTKIFIVPGHGICDNPKQSSHLSGWKGIYPRKDEPVALTEHVKLGVQLVAGNQYAVLCFTGGKTREEAGPVAESESYMAIARHNRFWGFDRTSLEKRILLETYAKDSNDNIILSLVLFYKTFGYFPLEIEVIGYAFKSRRFYFTANSLYWCPRGFTYTGINNPRGKANLQAATAGENNKFNAMLADRYLKGKPWKLQRKKRDPFKTGLPDFSGLPESVRGFLDHVYGKGPLVIPDWSARAHTNEQFSFSSPAQIHAQ